MNWFARLWSPRQEPKPAVARPASAPAPQPPAQSVSAQHFLPWLPGNIQLTDGAPTPDEQRTLAELKKIMALPAIPDNMLPRAAELVPQLIAILRETQLPLQAIAQRVSKDAVLAAEVMRLASSPYYRSQGDVTDIVQAIRLIGSTGLQTVIARVVLKPIYRGTVGSTRADVAARLWEHSEALARHTASLAETAGQPVFDGYLAGMLHNTGWKVALFAIERAGIPLNSQPSTPFACALAEQVHCLFGHAAQRWAITPGFMAFAHDARHHGLAAGMHPLAAVLLQAQQRCTHEALPSPR